MRMQTSPFGFHLQLSRVSKHNVLLTLHNLSGRKTNTNACQFDPDTNYDSHVYIHISIV